MDLYESSVSALWNESGSRDLGGNGAAHYLEGVGDYANSHELLSVVATIHHQRVGEALNDGTIRLSKPLDGIATSGMGDVDRVSDLNVVTVVEVQSAKGVCSIRCPQAAVQDLVSSEPTT